MKAGRIRPEVQEAAFGNPVVPDYYLIFIQSRSVLYYARIQMACKHMQRGFIDLFGLKVKERAKGQEWRNGP